MKSDNIGTGISKPEVTDISPWGIWLLYREQEFFLDHEKFPWFRSAAVDSVFVVIEEAPGHLRWPDLDVDLSIDCIESPDAFPLVYESRSRYKASE